MDRTKRKFKVGDLLVNKRATVLFAQGYNQILYGLIYIDIPVGEIVVVLEITRYHVTVQTENGSIGWQAIRCFEPIDMTE